MTTKSKATVLELCVMGFIAQDQSCTAYQVRNRLGSSLSSYWSNSAGSIYPLLERLLKRKWITVDEEPFGTRIRKRYQLAKLGKRELNRWLSAPVAPEDAAHTYDPLRTPIFFLDLVDQDQARCYLVDAELKTIQNLAKHRAELKEISKKGSPLECFGREGGIGELEARLKWIRRGLNLFS